MDFQFSPFFFFFFSLGCYLAWFHLLPWPTYLYGAGWHLYKGKAESCHSWSSNVLKGHFIMSLKFPASSMSLSHQVTFPFTFWEMSMFTQAPHLGRKEQVNPTSAAHDASHTSHLRSCHFSASLFFISNLSLFIGSFSLSYKYAKASSILKKKSSKQSLYSTLLSRNHFPLFSGWVSSFLTSHFRLHTTALWFLSLHFSSVFLAESMKERLRLSL